MPTKWFYNLLYRFGMEFNTKPTPELVKVLESNMINPKEYPKAIDFGCGVGTNTLYLAERGFNAVGVDFSKKALEKARKKAKQKGIENVQFIEGDITSDFIEGVDGPFNFLCDHGTLDDFSGKKRKVVVNTIKRLSKSGSYFLMYCWYGNKEDLPRISFTGASKAGATIKPGEVEELFGRDFTIERLTIPSESFREASFLMKRK
jgi:SAM-dependent methyltransferase